MPRNEGDSNIDDGDSFSIHLFFSEIKKSFYAAQRIGWKTFKIQSQAALLSYPGADNETLQI